MNNEYRVDYYYLGCASFIFNSKVTRKFPIIIYDSYHQLKVSFIEWWNKAKDRKKIFVFNLICLECYCCYDFIGKRNEPSCFFSILTISIRFNCWINKFCHRINMIRYEIINKHWHSFHSTHRNWIFKEATQQYPYYKKSIWIYVYVIVI